MQDPSPLCPDGGDVELRCDFCQSPIPVPPKTDTHEGIEYTFCTEACRTAMQDRDHVFTEYRGHRFVASGVAALDAKLPQGFLRNAAVLVSARAGTRDTELYTELAWRALQRDESVVFVTFQEPPTSVVDRFISLGWNVLPYLESGAFHILDCFTYRLENRDRMFARMNDWNTHISEVADPEVTPVRDPTNISELESRLDDCTENRDMINEGIVVIDSLTELGSLVQPVRAYNFVKDIRADICKGRFVPIFAGATYTGEEDQFPHDLEYLFDGVIDLEHNPKLVEDTLIKRLRVRKMNGVLTYPEWVAFEFTSDQGLVMFDPQAEIEKSQEENDDGDDTPADSATDSPASDTSNADE